MTETTKRPQSAGFSLLTRIISFNPHRTLVQHHNDQLQVTDGETWHKKVKFPAHVNTATT